MTSLVTLLSGPGSYPGSEISSRLRQRPLPREKDALSFCNRRERKVHLRRVAKDRKSVSIYAPAIIRQIGSAFDDIRLAVCDLSLPLLKHICKDGKSFNFKVKLILFSQIEVVST